MSLFAPRLDITQVELGTELAPRFDADGLLPAVVIDSETRDVLMLGYMNAEALERTILTGEAHFWSRSRKALWRKGEHSGFTQQVTAMLVDDDQDALVLHARINGPGSCHVGFRSCFYREVEHIGPEAARPVVLRQIEEQRAFDAETVYAGLPNPTII